MNFKLKIIVCLAIMGAVFNCSPPCASAEWTGNIDALLGFKVLNQDDWDPIQKNGEIGVSVDFGKTSWPLSISVDAIWSRGQFFIFSDQTGYITSKGHEYFYIVPLVQGEVKIDTYEANIGARKHWRLDELWETFAGLGLSAVHVEGQVIVPESYWEGQLMTSGAYHKTEGDGIGAFACVGGYIRVNPQLNIGLEYRYSYVKTDFDTVKGVNIGGSHYRLMIGYHW